MTYTAFPIANMAGGQVTSRKPWLIARDAFEKLSNCHLRRGVLEKKKGHVKLASLEHFDTTTGSSGDSTDAVMGLLNHNKNGSVELLAFDTDRANKYLPATKEFQDLTRKKIDFDATGQALTPAVGDTLYGNTSSATGVIDAIYVRFGAFATNDAIGTIVFKNNSTLTGTFQNGEVLKKDNASGVILGNSTTLAGDREFTGSDSDFFWGRNWNGVLYFTNGVDPIQQYDGAHPIELTIDLDVLAGPDNDVGNAKFIFVYKGRLLLLYTTERGSTYRQRARISEINLPGTWKDDQYLDAPTDHDIVAADFIDEDLVVWFDRSVWKLIYTGDPTLPFEWRRLDVERGCVAGHSLVARGIEQVALGRKRLLHTDGRFIREADVQMPDFTEMIADGKSLYSFGEYFVSLQQYWITYVDKNDTDSLPGHVLVYNSDEKHFATYQFPVHCLGSTNATSDLRIDDLGDTLLDDIDYSFDDASPAGSQLILIFGDRNGDVFEFNVTDGHDGSGFAMEAITGRWNPYVNQGLMAHLGWIDFLIDTDENVTFTLDHYLDNDTVATQTFTDLTATGTDLDDDKVWVRVTINAVGKFHRFKISNSGANNRPRIHALVPWFKAAGRIF